MERFRALLALLGSPQLQFASVLVAGTKGKGSTAAFAHACLQAGGLRVGRYTSPHLLNWRERTLLVDRFILPGEVTQLVGVLRPAVERLPPSLGVPMTFEIGTALSLLAFARGGVEAAVLEVGVGGRFDVTNVVEPIASAITPVSLDHEGVLGTGLGEIAWHKAGVLRGGRTTVLGPQPDEASATIALEAVRTGALIERVGRDWCWSMNADGITTVRGPDGKRRVSARLPLLGRHQRDNAATAVGLGAAALAALGKAHADPAALAVALDRVEWPGRLQRVIQTPPVWIDGAHNGASALALAQALDDEETDDYTLVIGLTEGKDPVAILRPLLPRATRVLVVRAQHDRAAAADEILRACQALAPGVPVEQGGRVGDALDQAVAIGDAVVATGSLFVAGEALDWARGRAPD